jgi:chemotaxis protein CheX
MANPDQHSLLLLDADPRSRNILVELSREFGEVFDIVEASTIEQALAAMRSRTFDLLVADTRTPSSHPRGMLHELGGIPQESAPRAIFIVSATVDEFEITVVLPTATLHTFTLNPDVYQKNLADHFKLKPLERKAEKIMVAGLDVAFMDHFMKATEEILKTFAKTECLREGLYLKGPKHISGDISGTMVILGETHTGSFSVSLEESCYLGIVSRITGNAAKQIDASNQDIASELCNQIFGSAKITLNAMGHSIRQGLPEVRHQSRHSVVHSVQGTCVAIRYSTEFGIFQIEAVLTEK